MSLKDIHVGFGLTGSHCTVEQVLPVMQEMAAQGASIYPLSARHLMRGIPGLDYRKIGKKELRQFPAGQSLKLYLTLNHWGPNNILDILVIAPPVPVILWRSYREVSQIHQY